MASTRRKSAAIALAVVGIAGLSLASASQLSLDANTLQAGTVDLADCQVGDVAVVFDAATFDAGVYKTAGVTLSDIHEDCEDKTLAVTVVTSGSPINLGTVTIDATSEAFTFAATDVASVTGIAAVISG